MSVLLPMLEEDFHRFKTEAIVRYANDQIAARRWSVEGAIERATAEFDRILPSGLSTPHHHIFCIVEPATQSPVGSLWIAHANWSGSHEVFVHDVYIRESFRRKGYARQAFQALEAFAADNGTTSIGLHVFDHNVSAHALYRSLGFKVTSLNMHKPITHTST